MEQDRRTIMNAGTAALLAASAPAAGEEAFDPIPSAPAAPTPGKPGDFDFLNGVWRISHRRQKSPGEWDLFEGEATCWSILGGRVSVEELRIPARDFSGMGLRVLDVEKRVWVDHWVNAKSGVVGAEGTRGSFENGVGVFISDDLDAGQPIKVAGIWDRIAPGGCRWRQAISRDGGITWTHNWLMDWTRMA